MQLINLWNYTKLGVVIIKLFIARFKVLNRLSKKYKDTFKLPRVSKVDSSYIRQYENNLDFLWFANKLKFL